MGNDQNNILAAKTRTLVKMRKIIIPEHLFRFYTICTRLNYREKIQEPQELKLLSSTWILSEITARYQQQVTFTSKV